MKKIISILVILYIFINCFSQNPSIQDIEVSTNNFLKQQNKNNLKLLKIIEHTSKNNNILHIIELQPQGFLIFSDSYSLPPIIYYSFENSFNNILIDFLASEIDIRIKTLKYSNDEQKKQNKNLWNELLLGKTNKYFEQWPKEGTTSTGGWLETNWTQNEPYNNFCPIDPVTNQRSIVGCPATAMAQIVNFHKTTNFTSFSDNDDYIHNYASRYYVIDDSCKERDFPCFSDLNIFLENIENSFMRNIILNDEQMAALSFACGVAAQQVYTSQGSGTFGVNQAFMAYLKFGFSTSKLYKPTTILYILK